MARKPKTLIGQLGFLEELGMTEADLVIPEIHELFTEKAEETAINIQPIYEDENDPAEGDAQTEYESDGTTVRHRPKKLRKIKYAREADPIKIQEFGQPVVMLHKNGPYLLLKGADPIAAEILRDAITRLDQCTMMRFENFWDRREEQTNADGTTIPAVTWNHISDWKKIELWRHLKGQVLDHPLCKILGDLGVAITCVPSLANYIRKEVRRQEIEDTPYPAPALNGEATLFERAGVGTVLRCVNNYSTNSEVDGVGTPFVIFEKGKRYMVVNNESDGKDSIRISTREVRDGVSLDATNTSSAVEWTEFHPAMEDYFDDSESVDLGPTVDIKYAHLVERMKKRLDEMGISLYMHQKIDAAMKSLKRGSIDAKVMRMGKTADAIATCALWGSNKVAVFGGRNALVDGWQKEFMRLGITDYVFVNQLSDLEKPARFYLMKYGWIREMWDPSKKQRQEKENYLRGQYFHERYPGQKSGQWVVSKASWINHHPCPHCGQALQRPKYKIDATGKIFRVNWTPANGYVCRNKECIWTSDNRRNTGASWWTGLVQMHRGGYVDFGLAAHRDCNPESIVGRKCEECGEVDSVWIPQVTKRFKKMFSAVIPDEIHNCKDEGTLTAKALYRMRARRRLGLTGTPISNSVLDSYHIMRWILGKRRESFRYPVATGKKEFELEFCQHAYLQKPTGDIDEETGQAITKAIRRRLPYLKNPADWWRFSAPKILRRNLKDPLYLQSLKEAGMVSPNCDIKTVTCEMVPAQTKLMLSAVKNFEQFFAKAVEEAEANDQELKKALIISQMTAMSIIATCPEWMNERLGRQVYDGPAGGGKMYNLETVAKSKMDRGGKVVILSDYTAMRRSIEQQLIQYDPIRYVSTWSDAVAWEAFQEFRYNPDKRLFIAGTRAISEGVDLAAADTVLCADLLWSPAFQVQAWNRILAPSQVERFCEVYLFQSRHSIDEHKYQTFYSKMVGADQALDRRVLNRRTFEFNIKWFAERIIEEEAHLALQLRDVGMENASFVVPEMSESMFEERVG